MLLYPLAQDVEKYKKKYKGLQKVMSEYKDTVDIWRVLGKSGQNELWRLYKMYQKFTECSKSVSKKETKWDENQFV